MTASLYRRSPHVLLYWSGDRVICHNFLTGRSVGGNALVIGLLDFFSNWKSADPLADAVADGESVASAIAQLHEASLLQRSEDPARDEETLMQTWASWNPAAGFFHFSTKDTPYSSREAAERFLVERAASRPPPAAVKTGAGAPTTLPPVRLPGPLKHVLDQRRTWRAFGASPVPLGAAATLLGLTFGAQRWMDLGVAGRAMLRTSPSAGARHPLEAYVVARHVRNLARGVYHYEPVSHQLRRVRRRHRRLQEYLPGQTWYEDAAMLVFVTAVFARTEWKYPFPRAYRTVLIEAGHFVQTFCLIATALKLAPFCTAALADSLIERDLRIDGITESVIYACGVGTRPPGITWAPSPDVGEAPRLVPIRSTRARRKHPSR